MELVKDELTRMQSFLEDANKKQAQDNRIRNWITEIRELALDTEDTIELFSLNVEIAKSRAFFERWACYPNHVQHLHKIGKEIQSILARLAKISESRDTCGIKNLGELGEPSGRSEVEVRRRLAPWEKDEHLVGLEHDVKKLLEPIMDEEKKGLLVAAIVGMGGIGKSTLAREVYNHPKVVSGRFDCRAWVVVSSEFTPLQIIKQLILETTVSEQDKKQRLEEIKKLEESLREGLYLEDKLKEVLHKWLEGKTYFIVLDDVWKKEDWDLLMTALPKEQDKTSRLILTTRDNAIASHCQSLHRMKGLDHNESWELFLKKALSGNNNGRIPRELEKKGREMVEKCEGLPLAITVMGGLLVETRSYREWEDALNQLDSHLGTGESSISTTAEAVLELSYENLSSKLKSCFLCLAFFKEDATIPVTRLVNIKVVTSMILSVTYA